MLIVGYRDNFFFYYDYLVGAIVMVGGKQAGMSNRLLSLSIVNVITSRLSNKSKEESCIRFT